MIQSRSHTSSVITSTSSPLRLSPAPPLFMHTLTLTLTLTHEALSGQRPVGSPHGCTHCELNRSNALPSPPLSFRGPAGNVREYVSCRDPDCPVRAQAVPMLPPEDVASGTPRRMSLRSQGVASGGEHVHQNLGSSLPSPASSLPASLLASLEPANLSRKESYLFTLLLTLMALARRRKPPAHLTAPTHALPKATDEEPPTPTADFKSERGTEGKGQPS